MAFGYTFPNEEVEWGILIVNYPFITGLVAGAFVVSSLAYVFGKEKYRGVSKLALLASLVFLIISPMPLVAHLRQPARSYLIMTNPNFSSAMAVFGLILLAYLALTVVETLFMFREGFARKTSRSKGFAQTFYKALTLGNMDLSEGPIARDHRIVKLLGSIGIPLALFFHGYVGFIFGAVKASPVWSTPLMPISFILSAIVSGVALLILIYFFAVRFSKAVPSPVIITGLGGILAWFLLVDFSFHVLEHLYTRYEQLAVYESLEKIFFTTLFVPHVVIEMVLGMVIPLLILGIPQLRTVASTLVASALVVVGVHAMRYSVVIGGQMLSRSWEGFLYYIPPFFGKESYMTTVSIYAFAAFLLMVFLWITPWMDEAKEVKKVG